MKFLAWMILLCAMLPVGVLAAEQGTASLIKELASQSPHPVAKKNKAVRSKKIKLKSKTGEGKAVPKVQEKPNAITETPVETIEQSVQIKGLRG